jgi:predicted dehydrogenase
MTAAIADPRTQLVVVGLPNYLHEEAVTGRRQSG